jgi:hypothetical protein
MASRWPGQPVFLRDKALIQEGVTGKQALPFIGIATNWLWFSYQLPGIGIIMGVPGIAIAAGYALDAQDMSSGRRKPASGECM